MTQMNSISTRFRRLTVLLAGLVLSLLALHGQAYGQDGGSDAGSTLSTDNPYVQQIMEVQEHYTDALLSIEGVVGVGVGATETGEAAIVILTESELGPGNLPMQLEGIPVLERVTGETRLIGGTGSSTSTATTTRFTRPVPIGISTANYYDCGAGTIGVRVRNGSNYYILSCNHVFARFNNASAGELVLQPGRADVSCQTILADSIGRLTDFESITYSMYAGNIMDAALVSTTPSMVANFTPQDGYGIPSSTTASAYVNQSLQKYGKATGLTNGDVVLINCTIQIPYPSGTTRFVNQILVEPPKKNAVFTAGGDSGSLVVTNNSSANPVGLAFAMSGNYTVISPIDPILTRFNVEIDDGSSGPLPVELSYFSGALMEEDVHLKWRTITELQNHAFHVQRSTDQRSWKDITVIPGAGTSNTPHAYGHVDAGIGARYAGQRLYYRLLQVDRDGTENYSSVLEVLPTAATAQMQIYPNPVRSDAVSTVQLNISEPMDGVLNVYDASGRQLPQYAQQLSLFNGTHVVPLSLSGASPGSYFLEFRSAKAAVRQRMILVR
ncbi:MAG: T9SS type A sorting domain-containing protein [Bacteroidota bacterium]|nr:T9SS type A sorting domain-containing protein [Bacteroidota bacterium]